MHLHRQFPVLQHLEAPSPKHNRGWHELYRSIIKSGRIGNDYERIGLPADEAEVR